MTAREFKDRLAAGDKLAVVMHELWKLAGDRFSELEHQPAHVRFGFEMNAAAILAALASAGVKK